MNQYKKKLFIGLIIIAILNAILCFFEMGVREFYDSLYDALYGYSYGTYRAKLIDNGFFGTGFFILNLLVSLLVIIDFQKKDNRKLGVSVCITGIITGIFGIIAASEIISTINESLDGMPLNDIYIVSYYVGSGETLLIIVILLSIIMLILGAICLYCINNNKELVNQTVSMNYSNNNYKEETNVNIEENSLPQYDLSKLNIFEKGLLLEIVGAQRILRIFDDRVELEQMKNVRAILSQNYFNGKKEIYYYDMIGIQTKDESKLVLGYIQFETASINSRNNFNSENSWTYDQRINITNETANCITAFIRSKIRQSKTGQTTAINQSSADELLKWKQLYDSGVISEAEFNEKKQQLLK